ncbi:alpha-methylacyl-CoA racemase-like isoform X4 [Biomphalaria pfeifferi]|uniref:Alpha-methylacyl-CoA racemase-like isoform X4 n=1 Tax=Biomphalaria pfeifferi TaxID=112525 RepID=A0AAD8B1L9_BIOPF|nr:alpha-methylacyl-CoA racemase-like isoform X4 [Biomphalaria pfeifferi]
MALKGIKVIELAGLAPVPYCGMILSDFGARVIRIDRPYAPNIDCLGRGKQSICVDLKKKEGTDVVKKLCSQVDVLVEPFRPGVMEKLGLGPEVLTASNPRLIYARLTGYGQTGILSKLGKRDEPPLPPVNLAADFGGGGLICALGIVMALHARHSSGLGQVIDANMVEGSAYLGSWIDGSDVIFNKPRGYNLLDGGSAFYSTYETKDGKYVSVGALEDKFYKDLIKGLGLSNQNISQTDDQDKQKELFAKIFLTKSRDEWKEVFKNLDACVTPVLTAEEASVHPHNSSKGTFQKSIQPPSLMANPAPRMSRTPEIRQHRPLPEIGQHTFEVLREFGYSQMDINGLIKAGAIVEASKL